MNKFLLALSIGLGLIAGSNLMAEVRPSSNSKITQFRNLDKVKLKRLSKNLRTWLKVFEASDVVLPADQMEFEKDLEKFVKLLYLEDARKVESLDLQRSILDFYKGRESDVVSPFLNKLRISLGEDQGERDRTQSDEYGHPTGL